MSGAYDRKAAAWVRKRYPGSTPIVGTVEFTMDAAAYNSGAWSEFRVDWEYTVYHGGGLASTRHEHETINGEAWNYNVTDLIRELVEMDDPGE